MDKLNHRSEGEIIGDKKPVNSEPKKFVELADKLPRDGSRDNCILSEFMQMRESKFSKVTNDNDVINYQTDTANHRDDNSRWSAASNPRLSKSSSTYSVKTVNSNHNGYNGTDDNEKRTIKQPQINMKAQVKITDGAFVKMKDIRKSSNTTKERQMLEEVMLQSRTLKLVQLYKNMDNGYFILFYFHNLLLIFIGYH